MAGTHRGMGDVDGFGALSVRDGPGRHAGVRLPRHVNTEVLTPVAPVLMDALNAANTGPLTDTAPRKLVRTAVLVTTGALIVVAGTSQIPMVRDTGFPAAQADTGSQDVTASLASLDYPGVEVGTVPGDVPKVEVPAPDVVAAPPLSAPVGSDAVPAVPVPAPVAPVAVAAPAPAVVVPPAPVRAPVAAPAPAPAPIPRAAPAPVVAPAASPGKAQGIASAALSQLGRIQDCTALVTNSLRAVGISFHGWPVGYLALGRQVTAAQAVPGNLIYYANGGMGVAHVAVYIGNGMAVHGGWNGNQTVKFSAYVGSGPVFIAV